MEKFVFDKEIFKRKFIQSSGIRNIAKNTTNGLDSICPTKSKNGNICRGYKSNELMIDTLHNIWGVSVDEKKGVDIETKLFEKIDKQVRFEPDQSKVVFTDFMRSMYFERSEGNNGNNLSLLRYQPASKLKDFGKFVADVLMDKQTKDMFLKILESECSPFDDVIDKAYEQLNILKNFSQVSEYARIFTEDLKELYIVMNIDFQNALDSRTDVQAEIEFLFSYYLFIYLSQIAIRLDNDLDDTKSESPYLLFKGAKEAISEDRDCVVRGWNKVKRKTRKVFKHLLVLNMLNCHDNSVPYYTYSDLFMLYDKNPDIRQDMNDAIDYLIQQYTQEYRYETDIEGEYVDFTKVPFSGYSMDPCENYKLKVRYLFQCVSFQLDEKKSRRDVVKYVADNYDHILKMRFVKNWGQLGYMVMISNDDLILMTQICQKASDKTDPERGIPLRDLFEEFRKRGLYMDGKTEQYIINQLIDINLIDSKCDSEEAQYVKRIQ